MNQLLEQEYEDKFDLGMWKSVLAYGKAYRKTMITLAGVMVLIAVLEAAIPYMTMYAVDNFIVPQEVTGLLSFSLIYGSIVVAMGILVWLLIALAGKVEVGLSYDIRKAGFQKLQELSFSYFDHKAVGWLMSRMTSDITRLGEIISWGLVDFVWGIAKMIAIMVVMLYLNWKIALLTMLVTPLLVLTTGYFQKKILREQRKVRKINSRITGAINEGITGAKATKVLVREKENLNEFTYTTGEMRATSIQAAIFSSLYLPVVLTLGSVGTAIALVAGGRAVELKVISYGTLVALISYTIQFFEPVKELARVISDFQAAHASVERVLSMIHTESDIQDAAEVIALYGDTFHPQKENWEPIAGEIQFKNVSFYYKKEEPILKNLNLNIEPGQTIALVGETGSGKSTIVNLACRFYEPTEGEILIDGKDYRLRSQQWLHAHLGYVLQHPHLFSGTVGANIAYGKLNATKEEIIQAARLVRAHDFIMEMEKGYDSPVGEGGGLLSTGQKQLISFARAILANPSIFVLDEATSSIDTETEQIIQHAIQNVLKGRTSFIIAHRLSTIRSADRILVVQKGKIIEDGNHQQLIKQQGYYYRLYTNQFIEEEGKKAFGLEG